jgi:hypothetical protein
VELRERGAAGLGGRGLEALVAQAHADEVEDALLVVDDQDQRRRGLAGLAPSLHRHRHRRLLFQGSTSPNITRGSGRRMPRLGEFGLRHVTERAGERDSGRTEVRGGQRDGAATPHQPPLRKDSIASATPRSAAFLTRFFLCCGVPDHQVR